MAHCDMFSMDPHAFICYSETFRNDLLGCTSDWTTAQLATLQSWGGIEAQTGKEGKIQKNSISSTNSVRLHRQTGG